MRSWVGTSMKQKNAKSLGGILATLIAIGFFFIFITDFSGGTEPRWGVTFSPGYAEELQLDWREAYIAILDELSVETIRLSAYWNTIESVQDRYDFTDLDWQLEQAAQRNVAVTLAVGRRLPRWPECHDPAWIRHLTSDQIANEQLTFVEAVVERYKNNSTIERWQVENEYFLGTFGICPPADPELLDAEIALVRSLDPSRQIVITDSGELSTWSNTASRGDILGTTLYRIVWNEHLGFFRYWFNPPAAYRWRADLAKTLNPNLKSVISMEVQAEPWTTNVKLVEMTDEQRALSFTPQGFRDVLMFTQKTGFPEAYLWGVEYWYWEKLRGNEEYWEIAKNLWQ